MTMDKRSMKTYLDDFRLLYTADRLKSVTPGPDDTEEKILAMRKILTPYSQSIALAKVEMTGGLPAGTDNTRSRRKR
jgi:hypothetical protein